MARLIRFDPRERSTPLQSGVQAPTQVQSGAPSVGLDASALGSEVTKVGRSLATAELKTAKDIRDRHMKLEKIRMESDFFDYSKQVARQIESGEISSEEAITSTFGEFTSSALENSPFAEEMEPDIRLISERYRQRSIGELLGAQERANAARMRDNFNAISKSAIDDLYDQDMSSFDGFRDASIVSIARIHEGAQAIGTEAAMDKATVLTKEALTAAHGLFLDQGEAEYMTAEGYRKYLKFLNENVAPFSKELAYKFKANMDAQRGTETKRLETGFNGVLKKVKNGDHLTPDDVDTLMYAAQTLYPDSDIEQIARIPQEIVTARSFFIDNYEESLESVRSTFGDDFAEKDGGVLALSITMSQLGDYYNEIKSKIPQDEEEIRIIMAEGPKNEQFFDLLANQTRIGLMGKLAEELSNPLTANTRVLAEAIYGPDFTSESQGMAQSLANYLAIKDNPTKQNVAYQQFQGHLMNVIRMQQNIDDALYVANQMGDNLRNVHKLENREEFTKGLTEELKERRERLGISNMEVLPDEVVNFFSERFKSTDSESVSATLELFGDLFASSKSQFASKFTPGDAWMEITSRGEVPSHLSAAYMMNLKNPETGEVLDQLNMAPGEREISPIDSTFAYRYLMTDPSSAYYSIFGTILGDANYNDQKILARAIVRAAEPKLRNAGDDEEAKKEILDYYVRAMTKDRVQLVEITRGRMKGQKVALPTGDMRYLLTQGAEGERYYQGEYEQDGTNIGDSEAQHSYDQIQMLAGAQVAIVLNAESGNFWRDLSRLLGIPNLVYHPFTDDNLDSGVDDPTRSLLNIGGPISGGRGFGEYSGLTREDQFNYIMDNLYVTVNPDGNRFDIHVVDKYRNPIPVYYGDQPLTINRTAISQFESSWRGTVRLVRLLGSNQHTLTEDGTPTEFKNKLVGNIVLEKYQTFWEEFFSPLKSIGLRAIEHHEKSMEEHRKPYDPLNPPDYLDWGYNGFY